MRRISLLSALCALLTTTIFMGCGKPTQLVVNSPDKALTLKAEIEGGKIFYRLLRSNTPLLEKSLLGFTLSDGVLGEDMEIIHTAHHSFSEKWQQPWGEDRWVDNTYNELKVRVKEKSRRQREFEVVFRLFNDGFGFRYEFPKQENMTDFIIMDEWSEFALTANHKSWSIPYETHFYEALYEVLPINTLGWVCTPLTMKTEDGLFLSIHEANLTDYAAMNLIPKKNSTVLKANLTPWSTGERVFMKTPGVTPWRTMIIAKSAGDLLLSRLMLNLNEPNKIKDTTWLKPGRYIGIWWAYHMNKNSWHIGPHHGATTQNAMKHIDFAAQYGFSGLLIEGWNKGWDTYQFSFTESYPDFDLKQVTDYARSKNIMIIGHHETNSDIKNYEAQIEDAFRLYQEHGVRIIKTGYVGKLLNEKERHSSQFGVRHYHKVIELAAKHKIMINNHEPVMPTGIQRTWPNLITQEGVRGQEWDAWDKKGGNPPQHTTIIPFTRGLAGPMDFTPGTFLFENTAIPTTKVQTTLAKQLALSVVLYSPLQMASDEIGNYEKNPAPFEFITSCPTNWERSVVPEAQIGEYITIARKDRKNDTWFVGSITNAKPRTMHLPLSFLDKDKRYAAKIFKDGEQANYINNPYPVNIEEMEVTHRSILKINQVPGGGTAIVIKNILESHVTSNE